MIRLERLRLPSRTSQLSVDEDLLRSYDERREERRSRSSLPSQSDNLQVFARSKLHPTYESTNFSVPPSHGNWHAMALARCGSFAPPRPHLLITCLASSRWRCCVLNPREFPASHGPDGRVWGGPVRSPADHASSKAIRCRLAVSSVVSSHVRIQ